MTRAEFEDLVTREGIDRRSFSLEGGLPPEQLVMSSDPTGWSVYYSERGLRTGLQKFSSEEAALDHLFAELQSDPSTRIRPTKKQQGG